MQTTKLQLILAEPEVPVPDTAYTGGFMGSASASGNIIAMIITVTILSIITGVIIYKLYKAKKLNLLIPVFLILGLTTATFSPLFINANKHAFATDSYATIETPEQVDMNGEIKESTFTSSKVTITKPDATNYGYELYILANEANDDLNFIPKTETNETVITSIEQEGALTANTYGFTLEQDAKAEDEAWYPLSGVADLLASYDTATTANNTTDVYFGVLTDNTVLPDTYTLDIDFYATTILATIDDLTFMQEFKSISQEDLVNVKDSMVLEQQYQLKDSRDNKTYYIAKLKDGNIWMTQNLDLNIVTGRTYTPGNTDIPSDWVAIADSYEIFAGEEEYYPITISYEEDDNELADRPAYTWSGIYARVYNPFQDICLNINESTGAWGSAVCEGDMDDRHYAVGNYYNYAAAIAVSNISDYLSSLPEDNDNYIVDRSICPAGWTLPGVSMFEGLLGVYNLNDIKSGLEPMYFIRSGFYTGTDVIRGIGAGGNFTINEIQNRAYNRVYKFNTPNSVDPSILTSPVSTGNSIRCVAR